MPTSPKEQIKRYLYLLVHPAVLAIYFLVIIFMYTKDYFQKYEMEIVNKKVLPQHDQIYTEDLDNDGTSEYIQVGYSTSGEKNFIRIQYKTIEGVMINQWNIRGKILKRPGVTFGDFNNNGVKEIYIISRSSDSLFLNIKELYSKNGFERTNIFISKGRSFDGNKHDHYYTGGAVFDTDADGFGELVFNLYSGFSIYPRNTFKYNIIKDEVTRSPISACGFVGDLQYFDLNNDSIPEIFGLLGAPENVHDSTPYTDSATWLMIHDAANMEFLFPPKRFETAITSTLQAIPFVEKGEAKLFCISSSIEKKTKKNKFDFYIVNKNGEIEISTPFLGYDNIRLWGIQNINDKIFFYSGSDIFVIDKQLNYKHISNVEPPGRLGAYNRLFDLDANGTNEYLIVGGDQLNNIYLYIFSEDFKDQYSFKIAQNIHYNVPKISKVLFKDKKEQHLAIQIRNYFSRIRYFENPFYHLQYPLYLGIYLVLFFFFWLLQKIQKDRVAKYFETEKQLLKTEKQLLEHQMALSKKQMEPHFMLNMINNIGFLVNKEDKQKAMYYLGKFAALMRRGLINSSESQISLEEEIEFVNDYLILQKRLMDNELEFNIKIHNDIEEDKILMPHSLIYTFVENAVKHGLAPKKGNRKLSIQVYKEMDKVKVIVIDNGIGRKKSKELKTTDTGKGMQIIKTIIKGYNQLYEGKIRYQIGDVMDDNNDSGTIVEIWL